MGLAVTWDEILTRAVAETRARGLTLLDREVVLTEAISRAAAAAVTNPMPEPGPEEPEAVYHLDTDELFTWGDKDEYSTLHDGASDSWEVRRGTSATDGRLRVGASDLFAWRSIYPGAAGGAFQSTRYLRDDATLGATYCNGALVSDFDAVGGVLYFDTSGERFLAQSNPGTREMIARMRAGERFAIEMYTGITKGAEDRKWEVTPTGATWLGSTNTILWAASAASAGATLRDSPTDMQRGTSWNGASSDSRDWSRRVRPVSSTTYRQEEGFSLASPIRSVDELGIVRYSGAIRLRIGADPANDFGQIQGVGSSPGFYFEKTGNAQHFYSLVDGNNLVVFTALKGGAFLFVGSTDATLGKRGMIYSANPPVFASGQVGHTFGWDAVPPSSSIHTRWVQTSYNSTAVAELLYEGGYRTYLQLASQVGHIIRGAASQSADLHQWQDSGSNTLLGVTAAGDLVPGTDNSRNLGTDALRLARVRAVDVVSGDLSFDDEGCDVCEEPFTSGQVLALRVIETETDTMGRVITHTVPIHLGCAGEC